MIKLVIGIIISLISISCATRSIWTPDKNGYIEIKRGSVSDEKFKMLSKVEKAKMGPSGETVYIPYGNSFFENKNITLKIVATPFAVIVDGITISVVACLLAASNASGSSNL